MTTHGSDGAGRRLADQLWLTIVRQDGNDLRCNCPYCPSHDSFGIDINSAVWHCFACGRGGSGYDLALHCTGDKEQAKAVMVTVGLFEENWQPPTAIGPEPSGNGDIEPADVIERWATAKGTTAEGFRAFGASPMKSDPEGIKFQLIDADGKPVSHYTLTTANPKGMYATGKPWGMFLPGCRPTPGERWLIVEGVKDAAALWSLGYKHVAGLPGSFLAPQFAPLFAGCSTVLVPDRDNAGQTGYRKSVSVLQGHATECRVAILPAELKPSGGDDVRDCLKRSNGPQAVRRAVDTARAVGPTGEPLTYPRFVDVIDCKQLLALDLRSQFLIRDVLVEGQPAIVGGRSKTLKTSILTDAVVSLGSGTPFLGQFAVPAPKKVCFWSGESGAAVVRETAVRIAKQKGIHLADCSIFWSFDLPKLCQKDHLAALGDSIAARGIEVVVIDPLYLSLLSADSGGRSSDLFFMGTILQPLAELGQATGCTFVLVHHFRKNAQSADGDEPCALESLAQSGVGEWARQWLLLERRVPYKTDGCHDLWMRAGGSAGHASFWGLSIDEGILDPETFSGRKWDVELKHVSDVRDEKKKEKDTQKAAAMEQKEGEDIDQIITALRQFPKGESLLTIRTAARLGANAANYALLTLQKDGKVEECAFTKKNQQIYSGYRLIEP